MNSGGFPFPARLGAVPTGPGLAAVLARVQLAATPDERLLEVLKAQWRQLAYQQAQVWAVMAELASRTPLLGLPQAGGWTPDQVFDSAVDEVRAELLLTRRAARREVEHAELVAGLPRVARAVATGEIDRVR